jgi:hypothetical protein
MGKSRNRYPGGWLTSTLAALSEGEGEGLSSSFGLFGLFRAFGPMNEMNQTNQIDQTNEINQIDQTNHAARGEGLAPSPSPLPRWRPPLAPPYQGGESVRGRPR